MRLKEQFINTIDNDKIMQEIIKEPTAKTHMRNRQCAGTNVGPKSGSTDSAEKAQDEMKNTN